MSTVAVGDIHGNLAALTDLLGQIRGEVTISDSVVFLGDYIDRGPDSRGCIDAILAFQRESDADVVGLSGNHEDWFLRTFRDYRRHSWLLAMDAFDTIRSYSAGAEQVLRDAFGAAKAQVYMEHCALPYEAFFDAVPPDHIRFFESLRSYYQTADCICTHGGLDPGVARLDEQGREALIWGRGRFPDGYGGAEIVVYGHRDNATLDAGGWPHPTIVGRTIGIDTISHGVLTAVRLPIRRCFRARVTTFVRRSDAAAVGADNSVRLAAGGLS